MDFYAFAQGIEATSIALWMRETLYALPFINAAHVIAIVLVFGTIFIVDLRLIGLQSMSRPVSFVTKDLLKWTWAAFFVAVITGVLMVAANATTFYNNTQFWLKMGAITLAGINMLYFELVTYRKVADWDTKQNLPFEVRFAGFASIFLWASVVVLGRWIGYSKGFNFDAPMDIDFDIDNLFGALNTLVHIMIA